MGDDGGDDRGGEIVALPAGRVWFHVEFGLLSAMPRRVGQCPFIGVERKVVGPWSEMTRNDPERTWKSFWPVPEGFLAQQNRMSTAVTATPAIDTAIDRAFH